MVPRKSNQISCSKQLGKYFKRRFESNNLPSGCDRLHKRKLDVQPGVLI